MRNWLWLIALCAVRVAAGEAEGGLVVKSCVEIAKVWAGHPVGFAFEARPEGLYVGFYDHERRMVIGHRKPGAKDWTLNVTDERVGWDSHNSIAFGFDREGVLHVAANMHCRPLRYWRTERAGDVGSLKAVHHMVRTEEKRCTYPHFFAGPGGQLLFTYRDGGSGNGSNYVNAYDEKSRAWRRQLDKPLFSGEGKMNAYPTPILADGRGVFHIAWVWRDTPDCSTNHDVSYARSRDLKSWETSDGRPLSLPITLRNGEVADPVPARGGLLNNVKLSLDAAGRPLIAYHKFDAGGNTQLYLARREKEGWKTYQTTDWDYRWDFKGGGSIHSEIGYSAATVWRDGKSLVQSFSHPKAGSHTRLLDGETLQPTGEAPRSAPWPPEVRKLESDFPGMALRTRTCESSGVTYVLRWETLGANRDRPRPAAETPPPSRLLLYELGREGGER
ncbi:MAG: hypothetical protein FJ291_22345 [Planctomycetes bacterium]|nr:hypothetical protein [Planctomycetota bacterium]